jgi:hypothetical protein
MSLSARSAWAKKAARSASKPSPCTRRAETQGSSKGRRNDSSSHQLVIARSATPACAGWRTVGSCIGVTSAAEATGVSRPARARYSETTAPPIECASRWMGARDSPRQARTSVKK